MERSPERVRPPSGLRTGSGTDDPSERPPPPGPARGPSRRRVALWAGAAGAVVVILLVAGAMLPLLPGSRPGASRSSSPGDQPPSPGTLPPNTTSVDGERCNAISSPTPSALLIPEAAPTAPLPAGGHLTARYEFALVNLPSSLPPVTLDFPSLVASFPLAAGSTVSVYFPPANFTSSGTGWQAPAASAQTITAPSALSFAARDAVFSSSKIAVSASVPYGNATLEVRWQWTETPPGGSGASGPWSVPTEQVDWPTSTPSIFFPAPFVTLAGSASQPAEIGTNYTVWLTGDVPGRYFYLEIETPSTGTLERSHGGVAPTALTGTYAADIPLLNWDDYLYPGTYLLHVHDACGALLYSFPVATVYAPSANVHLETQPSTCGPMTFDGSSYFSGSTATVKPASSPYAFTVPSCGPYSFTGWNATGGLHVASAGELLVSASGTFTLDYA